MLSNKYAEGPVSMLKTFKESRRFLSSFYRAEGLGASALYLPDRFSKRVLSYSVYRWVVRYTVQKGKAAGDDEKGRLFVR